MQRSRYGIKRRDSGFVYIAALLLLAVLATLSITLVRSSALEVRKNENTRLALDARLAAESGFGFMLHHLRMLRLPVDTNATNFYSNLATALGGRLNGTGALGGQSVTQGASSVTVPAITLPDGRSFSSSIEWNGGQSMLIVVGISGVLQRCITIEMEMTEKLPGAFSYGLASRGRIVIGGSTSIVGVNYGTEGNIFSDTEGTEYDAIVISGGDVVLSGDLAVSGDEGAISIGGSPSIGGTSDPNEIMKHLHFGKESPDFPELDLAPLIALATETLDSTLIAPGATFNNIRIPAGTNPTFNSDVVLNGIIYIESPNVVKFNGHAEINGFIVTENDPNVPLSDSSITFAGSVDAGGVESLPDTLEFADVKQQTGSFILAPGFSVKFTGSFATISGSIIADQLTFSGEADGTIKGSVVGLKDLPTTMTGSVSILVDRGYVDQNPAGIIKKLGFDVLSNTYAEVIQ